MGTCSEGHNNCDGSYHGGYEGGSSHYRPRNFCFPGGTKILTTHKGLCPIAELTASDLVISVNVRNFEQHGRPIKAIQRYPAGRLVRIFLGENRHLRVHPHHSLYTQRGWVRAGKLKKNDLLIIAHPSLSVAQVLEVLLEGEAEYPLFNLITSGEHNFVAEGFIAHNFTEWRALRTFFHRRFLDERADVREENVVNLRKAS